MQLMQVIKLNVVVSKTNTVLINTKSVLKYCRFRSTALNHLNQMNRLIYLSYTKLVDPADQVCLNQIDSEHPTKMQCL